MLSIKIVRAILDVVLRILEMLSVILRVLMHARTNLNNVIKPSARLLPENSTAFRHWRKGRE